MLRLDQPSTAVGTTRTKVRIGQEPGRLGYASTMPAPSASDRDFIRLPCFFWQCDFCNQADALVIIQLQTGIAISPVNFLATLDCRAGTLRDQRGLGVAL